MAMYEVRWTVKMYRVIEAETGAEAVRIARDQGDVDADTVTTQKRARKLDLGLPVGFVFKVDKERMDEVMAECVYLRLSRGDGHMNLVTGDYIEFTLAQFEGGSRGRGAKYIGDKAFKGKIENDWYDSNRRHWFSVRLTSGKLKRAQGKNLYAGITRHDPGADHAAAAAAKALHKTVQS